MDSIILKLKIHGGNLNLSTISLFSLFMGTKNKYTCLVSFMKIINITNNDLLSKKWKDYIK